MAGTTLDRKLFTAKFKRDYVACCAVAIFFVIVLGEVGLAISIPAYFVRTNLWDLQIARQGLMSHFDHVRDSSNHASIRDRDAAEENNIILWNLNQMADYLRACGKTIRQEEIGALEQDLNRMAQIIGRLRHDRPYNQALELKPDTVLSGLAEELNTGAGK